MDSDRELLQPTVNHEVTIVERLRKWIGFFTGDEWTGLSRRYVLLVFAVSIGLGSLLATTSYRSPLGIDETFEANAVAKPWNEMLQSFWQDPTAPLHYLLLRGWITLFGDSAVALRSLSTISFGLMIMGIGLTAWFMIDGEGAMVATLLAATCPLAIVHASSGRMYALLGAVVAFAALVFFQFINPALVNSGSGTASSRKRYIFPLIVLNVAGLLTQYIYIFFMCAYACTALVFTSRRTFLSVVAICIVSCAVFGLLWGGVFLGTLSVPATAWMDRPTLSSLQTVLDAFWHIHPWYWAERITVLGIIIAVVRWRKILVGLGHKRFLMLASIFMLSILIPFFVSQFRVVFFPERLPIIAVPTLCVCVAFVLRSTRFRVFTAVILLFLVYSSLQVGAVNSMSPDPDTVTEENLRQVLTVARCGDTLILPDFMISNADYYFRHIGLPNCIHRETFPLSTETHPGWIDYRGLLTKPELLSEEAKDAASKLAQTSETKVLLFWKQTWDEQQVDLHGPTIMLGPLIVTYIKDALDKQFQQVNILTFKNPYFPEVIVYKQKAPKQVMLF